MDFGFFSKPFSVPTYIENCLSLSFPTAYTGIITHKCRQLSVFVYFRDKQMCGRGCVRHNTILRRLFAGKIFVRREMLDGRCLAERRRPEASTPDRPLHCAASRRSHWLSELKADALIPLDLWCFQSSDICSDSVLQRMLCCFEKITQNIIRKGSSFSI